MKCPYCAEDIKDEAIVCHYCKRDLAFFKLFEKRIQFLERRISEITSILSELSSSINTSGSDDQHLILSSLREKRNSLPYWRIALSIFLTIAFIGVINVLVHLDFLSSMRPRQLTVFNPLTLIMGVWLGISWYGSHLKKYLLIGLTIGIIHQVYLVLFEELLRDRELLVITVVIVIIAATLFFTSGALFGDLIERKIYPDRVRSGFAEQLARKIITASDKNTKGLEGSQPIYEERVKRLSGIITAIAPILTLLGSIITAILGYLAASNK